MLWGFLSVIPSAVAFPRRLRQSHTGTARTDIPAQAATADMEDTVGMEDTAILPNPVAVDTAAEEDTVVEEGKVADRISSRQT